MVYMLVTTIRLDVTDQNCVVEHDSEAVVATSGHDGEVPGLERERGGNTIEISRRGTEHRKRASEPDSLKRSVSGAAASPTIVDEAAAVTGPSRKTYNLILYH